MTEAQRRRGQLRLAVDFDQLRQELSDHIVEGPQERYQLDWPGKREALLAANAPIAKTLRPCREESVDFDTTQNLFIEGDNLDALKLLQETYLGQGEADLHRSALQHRTMTSSMMTTSRRRRETI